jgi:hypothetical protein
MGHLTALAPEVEEAHGAVLRARAALAVDLPGSVGVI